MMIPSIVGLTLCLSVSANNLDLDSARQNVSPEHDSNYDGIHLFILIMYSFSEKYNFETNQQTAKNLEN